MNTIFWLYGFVNRFAITQMFPILSTMHRQHPDRIAAFHASGKRDTETGSLRLPAHARTWKLCTLDPVHILSGTRTTPKLS